MQEAYQSLQKFSAGDEVARGQAINDLSHSGASNLPAEQSLTKGSFFETVSLRDRPEDLRTVCSLKNQSLKLDKLVSF